jgi:broad specificity phosphatase PhoE
MEKIFNVVLVRHGEALHNLPDYTLTDSDFIYEDNLKIMNTRLTEKGEMQVKLVADRLRDIKFDLAISSDLKRAVQTAEAITKRNNSIEKLKYWSVARERCMGDFEGNSDVSHALWTIECSGIIHQDSMTWRPPNGESIAEFWNRLKRFLQDLQVEASQLPVTCPRILVVCHAAFMNELYRMISTSAYGKTLPTKRVRFHNTGIAQYSFISRHDGENVFSLEKAECTILSCANHLKNHDEKYVSCKGGCHGVSGDENMK